MDDVLLVFQAQLFGLLNSLPDYLRGHTLSHDSFRRYLKTYRFARY